MTELASTQKKRERVRYVLNVRLLVWTLVIIGIAAPAVYFWHAWSVSAMAQSFLDDANQLIKTADGQIAEAEKLMMTSNAIINEDGSVGGTSDSVIRQNREKMAEAADNLRKAVDLIWQYRRIHPDDGPSSLLLAKTFDRAPQGESNRIRSAQLYVEAIALTSDMDQRDELRLRVGEIYLETGNYKDAIQIARALGADSSFADQQKLAHNASAARIFALALYGQVRNQIELSGELTELGDALEQATQLNPYDPDLHVILASFYRENELLKYLNDSLLAMPTTNQLTGDQWADRLVDQMVEKNVERVQAKNNQQAETPQKSHSAEAAIDPKIQLAQAYLQQFYYRKQYEIPEAINSLQLASEHAPNDPEINLQQGLFLLQEYETGKQIGGSVDDPITEDQRVSLEKAKSHFELCIQLESGLLAPLMLGDVQMALGESNNAVNTWSKVIEKTQELSIDLSLMASLYSRVVAALINQDPNEPNESKKSKEKKDAGDYLNDFRNLIERYALRTGDPRLVSELVRTEQLLRANLRFKNKTYGEAILTLEKAIAEQREKPSPQTLGSIGLLADIYLQLGWPGLAADRLQVAVDLENSNPEFRLRLSNAYALDGDFESAAKAYEPLLRQENATADQWLRYSELLFRQESSKPSKLSRWQLFESALRQTRKLAQEQSIDLQWQLDLLEIQARPFINASNPSASDDENQIALDQSLLTSLQNLENQTADNPERIKQLVLINQQAGRDAEAKKLLTDYEELVDDNADRYIFAAELLASRDQFEAASEKLIEGLARVSKDQRRALELAQVNLKLITGEYDQAMNQLEELSKDPDSPELLVKLAELAIQLPNQIKLEPAAWEQRLKSIEGEYGTFTPYLQTQRALLRYEESTNVNEREQKLENAVYLCREMIRRRPKWYPAHSMAGLVYQLRSEWLQKISDNSESMSERDQLKPQWEQQQKLAIDHYQQAVDLGERRSLVFVRLSKLLENRDDLTSAGQLLELLDQKRIDNNRSLSALRLQTLIAQDELENAMELAIKATEAMPEEPYAWLDRARIEAMQKAAESALNSVTKAKTLNLENDNSLDILQDVFNVAFWCEGFADDKETKQKWSDEFQHLISEILKLTDEEDRLFENAKLFAIIGDERASDLFMQAENRDPNNLVVLNTALIYFLKRESIDPKALDETIRICERILQINSLDSVIRTRLGNQLANRGSVDDWIRIEELFGNGEGPEIEGGDQRLAVSLLINRDVPNSVRLKELARAESLVMDSQAVADLIIRAQVLTEWGNMLIGESDSEDRIAKLDEAAANFTLAAETIDTSPVHLRRVINFFIEQPQWDSAQPKWKTPQQRFGIAESYLRKMDSMTNDSILERTQLVALRARLMYQRALVDGTDNSEAIVRQIENYGRQIKNLKAIRNDVRARYYQDVATILESVNAPVDRVMVWRRIAVEQDQSQRLGLAIRLAKNGNLDEALDECILGYNESSQPVYVVAMTGFLLEGKPQPKHFEKAEPVFESALEKFAANADLLGSIANVRIACQNQVDQAIELYERALIFDPRNRLLLNNLATAYAELPDKLTLALQTIEKAIQIHGLRPGLMDTRAVIWMRQGNLEEAEKELRDIVTHESDSRFWCHLAEVLWAKFEKSNNVSQLTEAEVSLQKAIELGLEDEILTLGEKQRLAELRNNIDSHRVKIEDQNSK